MSHSIGIPGFVNERKQDIIEVSGLKRAVPSSGVVRNKRDRISMYRTRSYLPYRMSRSVKQRHKRGPALFSTVAAKPKVMYRRHKRLPQLLQNTFVGASDLASNLTKRAERNPKGKKQKGILENEKVARLKEDVPCSRSSQLRLNTHLWHTKRFQVHLQDGWYTPTKHISRGLKAVDELYDKCVVQDASHYTAHATALSSGARSMYVRGSISDVNELFALHTDPLEPLIFCDEDEEPAVTEAFEKEMVFHARGKFPAECIGPVMVLVMPGGADGAHIVQVRVSCHPTIAPEAFQALSASDTNTEAPVAEEKSAETRCTVQLAAARFNRLRLRGPDASSALLSILHSPAASFTSASDQELFRENAAKIAFLRAALSVRDVSKQFEDGDVIALSLSDPRVNARAAEEGKGPTTNQTKPQQAELVAALKLRPSVLAGDSPLFDDNAEFSFEAEHIFNDAKHSAKVRKWESLFKTTSPFGTEASSAAAASTSGSALEGTAANRSCKLVSSDNLPVLLIRKATPFRHFRTQKHRLSGWDIVLPAVWGSLVFRHLQLRGGAAAVGSEEMDHLLAKSGIPTFPRDFPDTPAGRAYWNVYQENERTLNDKRPPLKQIATHNLHRLLEKIANPANLGEKEGTGNLVDLSSTLIVRGESYLRDFLSPPFEKLEKSELEEASRQANTDPRVPWASVHIPRLPALPRLMFLQVLLVPTSKGLILDLAELVCPSQEDVAQFVRHKLHTQSKRTAARSGGRDAREDHIAVKGVYSRSVTNKDSPASDVDVVEDLPKEWEGVQLSRLPRSARAEKTTAANVAKTPHAAEVAFDIGAKQGRRVIGTVTTGQKEHLNNTHFAVGLCNVNALNAMFSASFGNHAHPQAHLLVLYRNARSDHLRPAIFQIV